MFTLYYRSHSDLEADLLLVGHLTCLTVPFVLSCRTVQKKVVHARARRGLTQPRIPVTNQKMRAILAEKQKQIHTPHGERTIGSIVPPPPKCIAAYFEIGAGLRPTWSPIYNPQQTPGQNHPLQNKALKHASSPLPYATGTLDWSEAQSFSVKDRCRVAGLLNGVRRASVGRPNVWAMEFFVGKTPDRFKCMRVYEPRNGQKQDHIFN